MSHNGLLSETSVLFHLLKDSEVLREVEVEVELAKEIISNMYSM